MQINFHYKGTAFNCQSKKNVVSWGLSKGEIYGEMMLVCLPY